MIASITWSLTEMCKSHLKSDRQDIDPDETAMYFDGSVSNPDMLMTFVRHCELDAHYQMAIASKVQILPLTKQLTNLAGNAWFVHEFLAAGWACLTSLSLQEQNFERWSCRTQRIHSVARVS